MRMDPRCKHLNELNDQYHLLFRQLAEGYLGKACRERRYREELCLGDYLLLYEVGEGGDEPVSMADVSRKLVINPSTATRRVNRLLQDGLVTKSAAPYDERHFDLRVTAAGRELIDQMDHLLYETVQFVYDPVTDKEMQAVYRFLDKCISQLNLLIAKNKDAENPEDQKDEQ